MTRKQAASFVQAAAGLGWLDAPGAAACLAEYGTRLGERDTGPGIDLMLVRQGLLSPDQARELLHLPGPPLVGECRLVRELGEGPHGRTVLVQHPDTCALYAVKVLYHALSSHKSYAVELARSAYLAQRLSHHSLAPVMGVIRDGDEYCYIESYIPGESLASLLASGRGLSPRLAVGHFCRIVSGLAMAQSQGLCHGNLTPSNIVLGEDGTVRVTGIGLLRVPPRGIALSGTGMAVYCPDYLSPEHFQVLKPDAPPINARSDIFSLGIILYELIAGELPFAGETAEAVYDSVKQGRPADPRDANPSVPGELAAVMARMLAAKPVDRYASHAELLGDLAEVRASRLPDAGRGGAVQNSTQDHPAVGRMILLVCAGVLAILAAVAAIAVLG